MMALKSKQHECFEAAREDKVADFNLFSCNVTDSNGCTALHLARNRLQVPILPNMEARAPDGW